MGSGQWEMELRRVSTSLMHKLTERHYKEKEAEFRAGGMGECEGEEGELGDKVGRSDFFISGDGPAKRAVHMPGYPEWYRNLCMRRSAEQWRPGAVLISAQTRVAPYLLRMKWKGFPLHYHDHLGWGYIVPLESRPGEVPEWDEEDNVGVQVFDNSDTALNAIETEEEGALIGIEAELAALQGDQYGARGHKVGADCSSQNCEGDRDDETGKEEEEEEKVWVATNIDTLFGVTDDVLSLKNGKTYHFFKLPHKDGSELNVGNPLAKGYLHHMETGTLTSAAGRLGQRILTLNSMISFWRSARQRILEQFVVWNKEDTSLEGNNNNNNNSTRSGVILPQLVVAGTVTRRAVEPTWLTASNARETRVGSELKVMVQAPQGHHFVGADVDSQELWIAAVLGDAHFAGMHGSTAIGWRTLQGNKVEGTDVHSTTAATTGITRDQAKVLNYGRIYGAGRPFIELLLKQFNPSLTASEVQEKARTLLEATKGKRHYRLTEEGRRMVEHCGVYVSPEGLVAVDDVRGMRWVSRYTDGRVWEGGSESQLFNKLEQIATSPQPQTPVLSCVISRALEPKFTKNNYFPSKVNWVVQSSAVDYLHLMLVAVKWLTDAYCIDARYCISIHDEVRYLVKSEDRYRFALALQYANLLTRSTFSLSLGLRDLPMSVAFFSAVDVDVCLRKEPSADCRTPSNPLGLEKGHNIPKGEALDIHQILEKTGGSLEKNN